MRVLVIDDSEIALQLMRSALVAAGHEVFTWASAIGISPILFRQNIDVVVVDIELASFRGDRLVEMFRKHRRLDHVGVVLVSGQPLSKVRSIATLAGADAAASKLEIELLPHAVEHAFSERNPTQIRKVDVSAAMRVSTKTGSGSSSPP
jgi:DNA-binding NtrC family response regulator